MAKDKKKKKKSIENDIEKAAPAIVPGHEQAALASTKPIIEEIRKREIDYMRQAVTPEMKEALTDWVSAVNLGKAYDYVMHIDEKSNPDWMNNYRTSTALQFMAGVFIKTGLSKERVYAIMNDEEKVVVQTESEFNETVSVLAETKIQLQKARLTNNGLMRIVTDLEDFKGKVRFASFWMRLKYLFKGEI